MFRYHVDWTLPELLCGEPGAVLVTVWLAAVAEEGVEVLRVLLGDLPRGHQRAAVLQQRLLVLNTGNIGNNCPALEHPHLDPRHVQLQLLHPAEAPRDDAVPLLHRHHLALLQAAPRKQDSTLNRVRTLYTISTLYLHYICTISTLYLHYIYSIPPCLGVGTRRWCPCRAAPHWRPP